MKFLIVVAVVAIVLGVGWWLYHTDVPTERPPDEPE